MSMLAMTAGSIQAQTLTNDASWCETIEHVLSDNGIRATANCDRDGNDKIVHLTIGNQTQRYRLTAGNKDDYSSTVLVVIDGLDYGPEWRHNNRKLTPRDWHYRSGLGSVFPDDVWEDARDLGYVEEALHNAVARATRTSELQPQYIEQNLNEGHRVLTLRCRVLDLQRGEQYAKTGNNTPNSGVKGDRRERPKVTNRLAYARVSVQLVDNMTGEVILNQQYEKGDYVYESSMSDPMNNVMSNISSSITSWFNTRYRSVAPRPAVNGNILKAESVNAKKGKAETVYIDCGTAQELQNGDEFTVYLVHNVNGNVGSTPIGKIKVKEIQGANLTLCKVSKGEKEIYTALNDGETLMIK